MKQRLVNTQKTIKKKFQSAYQKRIANERVVNESLKPISSKLDQLILSKNVAHDQFRQPRSNNGRRKIPILRDSMHSDHSSSSYDSNIDDTLSFSDGADSLSDDHSWTTVRDMDASTAQESHLRRDLSESSLRRSAQSARETDAVAGDGRINTSTDAMSVRSLYEEADGGGGGGGGGDEFESGHQKRGYSRLLENTAKRIRGPKKRRPKPKPNRSYYLRLRKPKPKIDPLDWEMQAAKPRRKNQSAMDIEQASPPPPSSVQATPGPSTRSRKSTTLKTTLRQQRKDDVERVYDKIVRPVRVRLSQNPQLLEVLGASSRQAANDSEEEEEEKDFVQKLGNIRPLPQESFITSTPMASLRLPRSKSATTRTGKGIESEFIPYNKGNRIVYTYFDDPNELCERLRLLLSSRMAGNTNHTQEINSIIEELRELKLIA